MSNLEDLPNATQAILIDQDMSGPSPEHIAGVFQRYADLFTAGDAKGITALYAPDAVVRDPVTGPEVRGSQAIHDWYQRAFDTAGRMFMELEGEVRVGGRYGAAAYVVRVVDQPEPFRSNTLDVMVFNDDGLIVSMDAYWGPTNIHKL